MGGGSNGKGRLKSIANYFGDSGSTQRSKVDDSYDNVVRDFKFKIWNDRIYINDPDNIYTDSNTKLYFQKDYLGNVNLMKKEMSPAIHSTLKRSTDYENLSKTTPDLIKSIEKVYGVNVKNYNDFFNKVKNNEMKPADKVSKKRSKNDR